MAWDHLTILLFELDRDLTEYFQDALPLAFGQDGITGQRVATGQDHQIVVMQSKNRFVLKIGAKQIERRSGGY